MDEQDITPEETREQPDNNEIITQQNENDERTNAIEDTNETIIQHNDEETDYGETIMDEAANTNEELGSDIPNNNVDERSENTNTDDRIENAIVEANLPKENEDTGEQRRIQRNRARINYKELHSKGARQLAQKVKKIKGQVKKRSRVKVKDMFRRVMAITMAHISSAVKQDQV